MPTIDFVFNLSKKKAVCQQKSNQYFFTIPKCHQGKIGKYCMITVKKNVKPIKSCRRVHLTK